MEAITEIKAGQIIQVPYPFKWGTFYVDDIDGKYPESRLMPGYYINDEGCAQADAIGVVTYEVVSVHKPGRFTSRVFYQRRWLNPDGESLGGNKLVICTITKFKRKLRGCSCLLRVGDDLMAPSSAVPTLVNGGQ